MKSKRKIEKMSDNLKEMMKNGEVGRLEMNVHIEIYRITKKDRHNDMILNSLLKQI